MTDEARQVLSLRQRLLASGHALHRYRDAFSVVHFKTKTTVLASVSLSEAETYAAKLEEATPK